MSSPSNPWCEEIRISANVFVPPASGRKTFVSTICGMISTGTSATATASLRAAAEARSPADTPAAPTAARSTTIARELPGKWHPASLTMTNSSTI